MENVDDTGWDDAYLKTMARLCVEYGDALREYYSAREQESPEVVARLELVVVEKCNVMQACLDRSVGGAGTVRHGHRWPAPGGWTRKPTPSPVITLLR